MADTLQVIPNMGFYKLPTQSNEFQGSGGVSPVTVAGAQYGNPQMAELQTMDTPVQGIDNTQPVQPLNAKAPNGSLLQPGWDKKIVEQAYAPATTKSISDAVMPVPAINPQQTQPATNEQPVSGQSATGKPKYQPGVDPYEYIFGTELRKPELNPEMQNRLRQRGLIDAFGRVAINLGDSMTLGMGGSPVLRPEQDTGRYMDEYYRNLEDYDKRLSDWDYKNYLNRLNASLRLNAEENDKAIAEGRIKQAEQEDLRIKAEKENDRKFRETENQKNRDAKAAEEEKNRAAKAKQEALNRAAKQKEKEPKEKEKISYNTPAGRVKVEIPTEDQASMIDHAKRNSEFLRNNKHLFDVITESDNGTPFAISDYQYERKSGISDRDILQAYLEYNSKNIPVPQREMSGNNPNYIPTFTDKKDLPSSGNLYTPVTSTSAPSSKKIMWPGAK